MTIKTALLELWERVWRSFIDSDGEGVRESRHVGEVRRDPPFMHHGTAVRDNDFFVNYQVAYEAAEKREGSKTPPPPHRPFVLPRFLLFILSCLDDANFFLSTHHIFLKKEPRYLPINEDGPGVGGGVEIINEEL